MRAAAMVEEIDFPWSLARAVDPYLGPNERHQIYIEIGVGETFSAIGAALRAIVRHRVAVGADLLSQASPWLDAYAGNADQPHLREVITQLR